MNINLIKNEIKKDEFSSTYYYYLELNKIYFDVIIYHNQTNLDFYEIKILMNNGIVYNCKRHPILGWVTYGYLPKKIIDYIWNTHFKYEEESKTYIFI